MERSEIRNEIRRLERLLKGGDRNDNNKKNDEPENTETVRLRLKKGERLTLIISKPH